MKNHFRVLSISFLVTSLCYCNSIPSNAKDNSKAPEFVDSGRAIDSLKRQYSCQDIEFENWEEDDSADSSLTVCFINSKIAPSGNSDGNIHQMKGIARKIKNVVAKPESYKSYYIIFVKRDTVNGLTSNSHTSGSDIPGNDL